MKLQKFLQDYFELIGKDEHQQLTMNSKLLQIPGIKEKLLQCDEFENVDEIKFMDLPMQEIKSKSKSVNKYEIEKTKLLTAQTIVLYEDTKFKNILYLYSIMLSPPVYDIKNPIKDNIISLPTMIDEVNFTPRKGITVFWTPEQQQDSEINGEEFKEQLVEKFRKALDSPDEYLPKGMHNIFLRGVFDVDKIKVNESEVDNILQREPQRQFVKL